MDLPPAGAMCRAVIKCGCTTGCRGRCRCIKDNLIVHYFASGVMGAIVTHNIAKVCLSVEKCVYNVRCDVSITTVVHICRKFHIKEVYVVLYYIFNTGEAF